MNRFTRGERAELEFDCSDVLLELLVTIDCDLETIILRLGEDDVSEELRLVEREKSTIEGREDVRSVIRVEDVVE